MSVYETVHTSDGRDLPIYWLTTIDNIYDPFDDFDNWYNYDSVHGYNSCGKIARLATMSPNLPLDVNIELINSAIEDILAEDVTGLFIRVKKKVPKKAL